jgi:hypothetical protein
LTGNAISIGERRNTKFWAKNLRDRGHFEGLSVDRKIILKWMRKKEFVEHFFPDQNMDQWRTVLNTYEIQIFIKGGKFLESR